MASLEHKSLAAELHEEQDGRLEVEAENFESQTHAKVRRWELTNKQMTPTAVSDSDPNHAEKASGGAYLELLPDTRRNHGEKLIPGENFSNEPGKVGVLNYKVRIKTPGKYYVWVRAYSTGSEDNGIHVGLDGKWPESGRRMQWCVGKNQWFWESRQRTAKQHCGVPHQIFLNIEKPGEHTVSFSMREDGFEFDKWLMTTDRDFKPKGYDEVYKKANAAWKAKQAAKPKPPLVLPRKADGTGEITLTEGAHLPWHRLSLTLDGPYAHEKDHQPNPFLDYRMTVRFTHESGSPSYEVPGYFAADGNAAETSSESGTKWRADFRSDKPGKWNYIVSFVKEKQVAVELQLAGTPVSPFDGKRGSFMVAQAKQSPTGFLTEGRLQYVGKRCLQFTGSKQYFFKVGADSPETLLAYKDFDGTIARKKKVPLKTWGPHLQDWKSGDPAWQNGKGKGLIGALNYLAEQGVNSISFIPYNAGGDGDNVWPMISPDEKLHYDCSKLDQWQIVFDHAQAKGLFLHFKTQETENDDHKVGHPGNPGHAPAALDGGELGVERKLYYRELIARFGYQLALNWNLGEENTQTPRVQREMAAFIKELDPYDHHVVIHSYPDQQDKVYPPLLGDQSELTGASLQNHWDQAHRRTVQWIEASKKAGKMWVVCNDEQGPADGGVPPDPGYKGFSGKAKEKQREYDLHDIRKHTLWGTLMAGGAGVEYYFGYKLPENDLGCQDFRSREQSWKYGKIAVDFFKSFSRDVIIEEMRCHDDLVANTKHDNSRYCLAKPGKLYLIYLPNGGETELDLAKHEGQFTLDWFDPRNGKQLRGEVRELTGGKKVRLSMPPSDPGEDWLAILHKVDD
ncbi:MAG: DUF5060 domain-containing protein [Lacipirellulaceae bacterium]